MGAIESKKLIGEKVTATKLKLESDITRITAMHHKIVETNPKFLDCFFDTFEKACVKKHQITDETILICWRTDALKTQGLLLATIEAIFKPPIQQYVCII